MVTLEVLGPYAVTTHVRDSVVVRAPARRGGPVGRDSAMGSSIFAEFLALYQKLCPKAPHATGNYHRPAPRSPALSGAGLLEAVFQKRPREEFARFVSMAKTGIHSWDPW